MGAAGGAVGQEGVSGKRVSGGNFRYTDAKGECVRSKSEKILADYFYQNNIPYKFCV